jgi:hypothetical protein
MLVASLIMGVVVWFAAAAAAPWLVDRHILVRGLALCGLVGLGVAIFAAFCQVAGVIDFRRVIKAVVFRQA